MADDLGLHGLPHYIGDEDHPITTWPTYGGISREPRLEDYVSVPVVSPAVYEIVRRALDEAEARTGAIEPAAVEKITPEQRFGLDMPSARPEEWHEPLRPSPLMRRLGYTAHPATCTHYRKRLYLGTTQWTCKDCGVNL